jgi:hypothetical protein
MIKLFLAAGILLEFQDFPESSTPDSGKENPQA